MSIVVWIVAIVFFIAILYSKGSKLRTRYYIERHLLTFNDDGSCVVQDFYLYPQTNKITPRSKSFQLKQYSSDFHYDHLPIMGSLVLLDTSRQIVMKSHYDHDGQLNGEKISWYDHDKQQLQQVGRYTHGIPVGEWQSWFANGQQSAYRSYSAEGQPIGKWAAYYANGNIKWQLDFSDLCTRVKWTEWYVTGQTKAKGDYLYLNGTIIYPDESQFERYMSRNGQWQGWHEKGELAWQYAFDNNALTGPFLRWHNNKQLYQQGEYLHGKATGIWQSWYPSGQKMSEGEVVKGHHHGCWQYWDTDGKPLQKLKLRDGQVLGATQ